MRRVLLIVSGSQNTRTLFGFWSTGTRPMWWKRWAKNSRTTGKCLSCRRAAAGLTMSMLGIPRMLTVSVQKPFRSSACWMGQHTVPFWWGTGFLQCSFTGLHNMQNGPLSPCSYSMARLVGSADDTVTPGFPVSSCGWLLTDTVSLVLFTSGHFNISA